MSVWKFGDWGCKPNEGRLLSTARSPGPLQDVCFFKQHGQQVADPFAKVLWQGDRGTLPGGGGHRCWKEPVTRTKAPLGAASLHIPSISKDIRWPGMEGTGGQAGDDWRSASAPYLRAGVTPELARANSVFPEQLSVRIPAMQDTGVRSALGRSAAGRKPAQLQNCPRISSNPGRMSLFLVV